MSDYDVQNSIVTASIDVEVVIGHCKEISEKIARGAGGREMNLATTKLQEAVMWLVQANQEVMEKSHS